MAEHGAPRGWWLGLAAAAAGLALVAAAQPGADAARQLEAAIHREVVLGDLKGAIEGYRKILGLPGENRALASRALFQMGQCEEKLGNRAAAEDAYRRVSAQYSDQEQAAQARVKLAEWEGASAGPHNLNFEDGTPAKVPPGWFALALPKDADFLAQIHRKGCRSGTGCVVVQAPLNSPRRFGNMMQSFSAAAYRGRTVRLRAWMRLESTEPDDRGQMWLAVVRSNRRNGFSDNMDDRPVRSSQWMQCEIVGEVDRDAQFIDFGFMSSGKGRVWVDDVTFQIVRR